MRAHRILFPALLAVTLLAAACGGGTDEPSGNNGGNNGNNGGNNGAAAGELLSSTKQRITAPDVDDAELATLTRDNRAFALDLYHEVRQGDEGNLFYSPHSISIALAMTWGGARGTTADAMAETLHFTLGPEAQHEAFNALDLALSSRGQDVELPEGETGDPFRLSVVNAIWGQRDYEFLETYLDLLALNYGAGLRVLDFLTDPEGSREIINTWVEDQTEDRIKDLLPPGSIGSDTRLVLTNAVYFKASWLTTFDEERTADGEFERRDGTTVTVPLMHLEEGLAYNSGDGWAAAELPYVGHELSMVVIVPEDLETFEAGLDVDTLDAITDGLHHEQVAVTLPKFSFDYDLPLNDPLMALGMGEAFEGSADFSGINGSGGLQITDVLHKAFVAVDEEGTEAAAATAVVVGETSVPPEPIQFEANRPFLFLVRDIETGAIIFIGRVVDPS